MRVGIFGGTFDPVHKAHIQIIESAIQELQLDKLIVTVAFVSPGKEGAVPAPAYRRLEMARIAFSGMEKVEVSDLEIRRGGISYTVETVESIGNMYPGAQLFLILGEDKRLLFSTWYRAERIRMNSEIYFVRRGTRYVSIEEKVLHVEPDVISSSGIRERIQKALPVSGMVPREVETYIYEHGLYFPERIHSMLDSLKQDLKSDRFAHVCRVVRKASEYALRFGTDPEKTRLAALLHDCAKSMDKRQLFVLSGETDFVPSVLHAPAGAVVAKNKYGIQDEEVLRAIRLHCTADAGMNPLAMVVFLADMTEDGRDFPSVNEIRDSVWRGLDFGMLTALNYELNYLREQGAVIHPAALRALSYYKNKEA